MAKVNLVLEAVVEDDGNIYLTHPMFDGSLIYYPKDGGDPEQELCMLSMSTMLPTSPDYPVEKEPESSMAQVIAKSNQLMAEVKRLRSKLM